MFTPFREHIRKAAVRSRPEVKRYFRCDEKVSGATVC